MRHLGLPVEKACGQEAGGAGPPGEVSGCLALVPEAACGPEVTAGLGTRGWLCVERLSLGGLLREASLERRFPPEGLPSFLKPCPHY